MKKLILLAIAAFIFTFPVYAEDTDSCEVVIADTMEYSYKELLDEITAERLQETEDESTFSLYNLKSSSASTDVFSYYDQLNDIEQEMYDCLDENIDSTIDGTTEISIDCTLTIDKQLNNSNFWTEVYAVYEDEMGYSIYAAALKAVFAYLYLDHPQYFWIDLNKTNTQLNGSARVYENTSTVYITISFIYVDSSYDNYYPGCYESQSDVEADYSAMMTQADEIIASVPANSSSWGKLNYYMNWFRDNCTYNKSSSVSSIAYLAPSALLYGQDSDGSYTENSPVCEGYCEALKILCDLSDINCICAEAVYTSNGVITGHKFNLIELDGSYYYCDPTWFDTYGNTISSYRWMLTGSTNMAKYDTSKSHTIVYQLDFSAPTISSTDYWTDFGINGYAVLNVDGNSTIDRADNASLLRIISGIDSGTGKDVNSDGQINLIDVILMEDLMFD